MWHIIIVEREDLKDYKVKTFISRKSERFQKILHEI